MWLKIMFIFVIFMCMTNVHAGGNEGDSCTKDGVAGMCTDLSMCPVAIQDIKNRKTPQICSFNKLVPVVCCVNTVDITALGGHTTVNSFSSTTAAYDPPYYEYEDSSNETICKPIPSQLTASKNGQKAWDKCIDYQQLVFPCEQSPGSLPHSLTMRRVNRCHHGTDEPIFSDSPARTHEFPHAALLGFGNDSQLQWLCSGSLISEQFLLTAAHCTNSREYGPVTYAALRVTSRDGMSKNNRHKIKRVIRHPGYEPPNKHHDIALLEMENPIRLDSFTVPACLDSGNSERNSAVSTGRGPNTTELLMVHLSKFSTAECAKLYPGTRRFRPYNETSQLCYGSQSQALNICQDDGGSPLMVRNLKVNCMYTIIGITSYGKGCFAPGVYTRVRHYLPWIEGVVWP